MTEDDKHYGIIRAIVQEEVKPIYRNINWFVTIAGCIIAFVMGNQFYMAGKFGEKANVNETMSKLQYYQLEDDEHRMLKELFPDVNKATGIFDRINDNSQRELGFKLTYRGGPNN